MRADVRSLSSSKAWTAFPIEGLVLLQMHVQSTSSQSSYCGNPLVLFLNDRSISRKYSKLRTVSIAYARNPKAKFAFRNRRVLQQGGGSGQAKRLIGKGGETEGGSERERRKAGDHKVRPAHLQLGKAYRCQPAAECVITLAALSAPSPESACWKRGFPGAYVHFRRRGQAESPLRTAR